MCCRLLIEIFPTLQRVMLRAKEIKNLRTDYCKFSRICTHASANSLNSIMIWAPIRRISKYYLGPLSKVHQILKKSFIVNSCIMYNINYAHCKNFISQHIYYREHFEPCKNSLYKSNSWDFRSPLRQKKKDILIKNI